MLSDNARQLCVFFADVIDYPGGSQKYLLSECPEELKADFPASAASLSSFVSVARSRTSQAMEEEYARAFDLAQSTTLYLGCHLFGESTKRSVFLLKLHDAYSASKMDCRGEMGDHLCVILKFLSVTSDWEFSMPLVHECVLPALQRIEGELQKGESGYWLALNSIRLFLHEAFVDRPDIRRPTNE